MADGSLVMSDGVMTDAASDVAEVVAALELGPVDVVGHSMGGFVAGFFGTDPGASL